jgi:hypothetical protein
MYTLIVSAKMNDIDPQAWLADVLARLPDMPMSRVQELLPWNWTVSGASSSGLIPLLTHKSVPYIGA